MTAYFDCGFSVREPAWHGLATVLEDYPEDWDDARRAAGLLWEPTLVDSYTIRLLSRDEIETLPEGSFELVSGEEPSPTRRPDVKYRVAVRSKGFKSVARDDTGAVLAQPTDQFSLISHALMGEIIEAILGDSNVKFETAGSIQEGRKVWALVRLDEPFTVTGDNSATYPFLALLNPHDGSGSCTANMTQVKVICWNTWQAADAEAQRDRTQFRFRHVGDVESRIAEAKDALAQLRVATQETQLLFEELARTPVNGEQVKTFEQLFLPSPADRGEFCSDRVASNVAKARATFHRLYEESETMEGIHGNAYGLLQASTEYLDHVRAFRTTDSYVGRTILKPESLKERALALVRDITKVTA